ncbi:hypothetical protein LSAT2_000463 [Lamellibrachia satsuma]|nr:hypothetical protein LSAT2_000463 [Lamellibrachia satsuma]
MLTYIFQDFIWKSRNARQLGKKLGLSRDLGKRYCRKRLQLRRVDYLSKEELMMRFLKRPDSVACMPGKNDPVTTGK